MAPSAIVMIITCALIVVSTGNAAQTKSGRPVIVISTVELEQDLPDPKLGIGKKVVKMEEVPVASGVGKKVVMTQAAPIAKPGVRNQFQTSQE
jgi:hypothetical protein